MDVSYHRVNNVNNDINSSRGPRERWQSKAQFVLSCLGSTHSVAHLESFAYYMYREGGGVAFLIPYFIVFVFMGIPFLLMVLTVGQYTRNGPVKAVEELMSGQPKYHGIGFAVVAYNFVSSTYFIVLVAWMLLYLVASFHLKQPYNSCDNIWNTEQCYTLADYNASKQYSLVISTEEYFRHKINHGTYEDFGSIQWEMFGFFTLAWLLVYICLHKGITSYGKVVCVTATIPYLVLTILVIVSASLEGSREGIYHFFKPNWENLLMIQPWIYSGLECFYALALTAGSMITLSSYNDFHSRTLVRDTLIISFVDLFTKLVGTCVFASFFGHFAHITDGYLPKIVSTSSLVYDVFPAVASTMPVPQLWCVLFFTMCICLMINHQFGLIQVVITTVLDGFPKLKPFYCNRKEILVLYICLFTFACGIPCTFQGGYYYLDVIWYYSYYANFLVVFLVVATISFLYGTSRLLKNFEEMTSSSPNIYFVACWYIITPIFVFLICVAGTNHLTDFHGFYDWNLKYIGWSIVFFTVIWIPSGFLYWFSKRLITNRHQSQDHSMPLQRVSEPDRDTREAELTDTIETAV